MKKLINTVVLLFAATTLLHAQWTHNGSSTYLNNINDNVGIGTTTPAFKLDIQSAGSATMSFKSTGGNANVIVDRFNSASTAGVNYRTNGIPYWQTGTIGTDNYAIRNINLAAPGLVIQYTTNNVGIGTTTPANKLSVTGNANFSGKVGIGTTAPLGKLDVTDNSLDNLANFEGGNNMFITLKENGNYRGYLGSWSGAAEDVDFGTGVGNTTGAVNFTIQAAPKMTISNSGNVGIGNTNPYSQLAVSTGSIANNRGIWSGQFSNSNFAAVFGGRKARGTEAAPSAVAASDYTMGVCAQNFDGANYINNGSIGYRVTGAVTPGNVPGEWYFGATNNSDVDPYLNGTVRMVVQNTGNVGIGTITPAYRLEVNADVSFNNVRVGRGNGNLTSNLAVGNETLNANTTGDWSTAIGVQSLASNTTGYSNTAIGYQSLFANNVGNDNTATGTQSLFVNTTGSQNTANGYAALQLNETGSSNTATGSAALADNISGSYNTAVGKFALLTNQYGNYNTAIGYYADVASGIYSNSTAIGYNAKVAQSNSMVLGDTTNILVGIGTGKPSARFHVKYNSSIIGPEMLLEESENDYARLSFKNSTGANFWTIAGLNSATNSNERLNFYNSTTGDIMSLTGNGRVGIGAINPGGQFELGLDQGRKPSTSAWTITSDARLKNIEGSYSKGLKEIMQLNPVVYHYKNVGERKFDEQVLKIQNVGFSAQEVQKVFPECVGKDEDGYLNLNIHAILVAQVNAIKEQQQEIESKDQLLNQLQNKIEAMSSCLESLCSANEFKSSTENSITTSASKLEQNNPNPFKENTTIGFYISSISGKAMLKVFSMNGEELKSFEISTKGKGQIEIAGNMLAPGVYTYVLIADEKTVDTKQMVVTK